MSEGWFRVGHVTDEVARTGCSVIVFDAVSPAAVDVRGGAPGTRETTLLDPAQRGYVDAIVLSGGSSFGLGTADGVMRYLEEQGRGFQTAARPVPLVPAAIVYDLSIGEPVNPDAEWGYRAASAASYGMFDTGQIGAGTGTTVAKLGASASPAGIGWGFASSALGEVSAMIVVNAVGDVVRPSDGKLLRVTPDPEGKDRPGAELLRQGVRRLRWGENTTIGCVMIDAALDHWALKRAVIAAHDGLARCIHPVHTVYDGDTLFAVAREDGNPEPFDVASLCVAVSAAVEAAVVGLFDTPS